MENIEENNRLIAEFTFHTQKTEGLEDCYIHKGTAYHIEDMEFHNDWNWLMKCVEKTEEIENHRFDFEIRQSLVEVYDKDEQTDVLQEQGDEKMEVTYWCVVEFIKWYNQQK